MTTELPSGLGALVRRHPVITYALLTYAISWLLTLPLTLNGFGVTHTSPPAGWHALGALGPVAAALIVTGLTEGRAGVAALWDAMRRWRVGWLWWLVAVGSPLLMFALAVVIVGAMSGHWLDFSQTLSSPDALRFWLINGVFASVVYGIGEEPGWRGFALPRLERRWNALVATLLVFAIWAIFHTPFFFYRYSFGLASIGGFLLGLLAGAIWLTYLYNSASGSVLIVMVWHTLFNLVSAIAIVADPVATVAMSVIAVCMAIFALAVGTPARLASPHPVSAPLPSQASAG